MLRDATTGDWIGTFSGHKGAVWSCRLDPMGLLAGTASGDFSVRVWDAITGASLYNFGHKHVVKTLDWSCDSKRLATGGHEGILRVFDISKPKEEPLMFVQSAKEVSISAVKRVSYMMHDVFKNAHYDSGGSLFTHNILLIYYIQCNQSAGVCV